MRFKIAGIQMSCSDSPERNLKKASEMALYAVENGAKVVCFQQLFHLPWFPSEAVEHGFELAEDEDGPAISLAKSLAAEHGAVMVCPIFEKAEEGVFYNTAFVIDTDGSVRDHQ